MARTIFLMLALLAAGSLWLAAQDTRLSGPVSGVVFSAERKGLCPIQGVPGASYLGSAIVGGLTRAFAAPDSRSAVVVEEGGVRVVSGLLEAESRDFVLPDSTDASLAAWSADSSAFAVYDGASGELKLYRLAAGGATLSFAVKARISALAVDGAGAYAVAAAESGEVFLYDSEGPARLLATVDKGGALAISGADLYIADAGRGEILVVRGLPEASGATLFARELGRISGLAVTPDGRAVLAASGSERSLRVFDPSSGAPLAARQLEFEPTRLQRLSPTLFLLKEGAGQEPFQVLDISREMGVYFVPAGEEN